MLQNHNNTLFFSFNLNTSSLFSTSLVALMTACHVNTYNKLIKFLLRGQKEKRQSLEAPKWKNHSIRCHSSPLRCRAVICPQMRCVEHGKTESQSFVCDGTLKHWGLLPMCIFRSSCRCEASLFLQTYYSWSEEHYL